MPNLYGQPKTDALRKEINKLRLLLCEERKERRNSQLRLQRARIKIEELESVIKRTAQKAQELLSETATDVEASTKEKFIQSLRPKLVA